MKVKFQAERSVVMAQLHSVVEEWQTRIADCQKSLDKLDNSIIDDPYKEAKKTVIQQEIEGYKHDCKAIGRQLALLESVTPPKSFEWENSDGKRCVETYPDTVDVEIEHL